MSNSKKGAEFNGTSLKRSLDYFSFDSAFFADEKIKKVRTRFGCSGIAVYIYLISQCYFQNGYYLIVDEDTADDVCDYLRIDIPSFQAIYEYLTKIKLLEELEITSYLKVISSKRIQKNFLAGVKHRAKKNKVKVNKFIWLLSQEETAALNENVEISADVN